MKEVISYMSIQDKDISEMTTDMMIFWMKMTSVQVKITIYQFIYLLNWFKFII